MGGTEGEKIEPCISITEMQGTYSMFNHVFARVNVFIWRNRKINGERVCVCVIERARKTVRESKREKESKKES